MFSRSIYFASSVYKYALLNFKSYPFGDVKYANEHFLFSELLEKLNNLQPTNAMALEWV